MTEENVLVLTKNRKARHDFFIEEVIETGIELQGTEVKSCRNRSVNLKDGFARITNGEVYLHNIHISPYKEGNQFNHDPERPRRLLLHKRQIKQLTGLLQEKGFTLIPLSMYVKRGKIKVELGVAKGKRKYDKRETIKRKTQEREMERAVKENMKY